MPKPLLTLTTDFGADSHYVAAMKGVILGICPPAQVVDVCHHIAPYGIDEAAYTISQTYPCFPGNTIHIVVVDPGVGSSRRPILMQAAGQYFLAPDNGVLAMIYTREKHRIRAITQPRYFRHPVSNTFHGRDIFSPVAAHLAKGVLPARFGPLIDDYLRPATPLAERIGKHTWIGRILKIDRFGNVITSFHSSDFPNLEGADFTVTAGGHQIDQFSRTYADAPPGELFAIIGSGGYLEISVNQDSAAKRIACDPGAPLELKLW